MSNSLVPAANDSSSAAFAEHIELWERATELLEILKKLPSQVVLRSGLSGRRNAALESFDGLTAPELDGQVAPGAIEGVAKWNRTAEVTIAGIIKLAQQNADTNEPDPEFVLINKIDESDFYANGRRWPWGMNEKKSEKIAGFEKGTIVKAGVVAGLVALGAAVFMEKEE